MIARKPSLESLRWMRAKSRKCPSGKRAAYLPCPPNKTATTMKIFLQGTSSRVHRTPLSNSNQDLNVQT